MQLVVEDALNRLAPLIERFGAEIQMSATWPVSLGYGPWVEQVWVNYLINPDLDANGSICIFFRCHTSRDHYVLAFALLCRL